ncbi:MAG: protein kinase domain-containing protein [Prochlorothrix sp.]
MVSIAFLEPQSLDPLRWWEFRTTAPISIGRSADNDIVLKDSLISRRHVELRPWSPQDGALLRPGAAPGLDPRAQSDRQESIDRLTRPGSGTGALGAEFGTGDEAETRARNGTDREASPPDRWIIRSLGKNGTFLNRNRVEQAVLEDGDIIQLASKGPRLRFYYRIVDTGPPVDWSEGHETLLGLRLPEASLAGPEARRNWVEHLPKLASTPGGALDPHYPCFHPDSTPQALFCIHCGQPLLDLGKIGRYQILKPLSRGGMGATFLAWKQGTLPPSSHRYAFELEQRLVVLKQMREEMARSKKARELFEREARTLQRLHHPNIPQFLDFFSEKDELYLVMAVIQGLDLKRYVRQRGTVTPDQVLDWALQVCDVLEYLHSQDPPILHRDIKPANLVLRYRDQRIVVVDFGAVKSLSSAQATRITAGGYTAPEQERGHPRVQSDLYSLGATLIFLLTAKNPMQIHHYQDRDAQFYQKVIPGISQMFAGIISRLLDPGLEKRYGSVQELRQALRVCRVNQPEESTVTRV